MYPYVADVLVILDGSASVTDDNFGKFLEFTKALVDSYNISENGFHLGVIEYSDNGNLVIPLNGFYNNAQLKTEIDKIRPSGGSSRTDKALELAWREGFSEANGARITATKIVVLVTDGKSSGKRALKDAVVPLKRKGAVVHVVTVGEEAKDPSVTDIGTSVHHVGSPENMTSVVPALVSVINKNIIKGKYEV